jgi:geranylgeranyl diphosphate synthase type I
MDAKSFLKDYTQKVEPIIARIFDRKIAEAKKISPICTEIMGAYKEFMGGGKKLRGALVKLGYDVFGGKNQKAILEVSTAVEIIHSFLLIHDDVMDKDTLRRGRPTVHHQYESFHKQRSNYKKGDSAHFGTCMAIDAGDAGMFLALGVFGEASFSEKIKIEALSLLSRALLNTAYGQALDVTYEVYPKVTYKHVMQVHTHKTAYYTVTGPLSLGATLAGMNEKEIEKIEAYGQPVGTAFQIRDDELGLFSDEKSLGKPIGSDIKENKNTLLHLKALKEARGKDRKFLKYAYGNRDLTDEEVERVREITIKTGALNYSQKIGWELVSEGKKHIDRITKNSYYQVLLSSFADFMMERKN